MLEIYRAVWIDTTHYPNTEYDEMVKVNSYFTSKDKNQNF